ncbi:ABC transporter permease [Virgibacillus sp. W0181]|uniref:ABC transporter permease n=1 Tax=Virgibacillus sp. W0181 TaxID=3391581 RepID=UPI003F48DCE8
MFDAHNFFKQRLSAHVKETSRYLRYMFNGHIAVAMIFLISALAVYYQQWLMQLPDNFPTAIVIGIIFGLIVSYNPVRTLLKEPDLVFIIVAEQRMGAYFRNALLYGFIVQLYLLLLVAAALGPLYFHTFSSRSGSVYLWTLLLLLLFKIGNLFMNWNMLKVRDANSRRIDIVVRVLVNSVLFYFILKADLVFAGITSVIFVLLFLYTATIARKQAGVDWNLLVEKDQIRMQFFYRLASMFAEVPHLKIRIKKRRWLAGLLGRNVKFSRQNTYDYLYRLTFIRSGDYLGMYLRLIIIGGVLIYIVPMDWLKLVFAILFIYLSSFQLTTLYTHHRTVIWIDLYPVEEKDRLRAFIKWVSQLTIIQTSLFALLFLFMMNYTGAVILFIAGLIFNYLFHYIYMKQKLA